MACNAIHPDGTPQSQILSSPRQFQLFWLRGKGGLSDLGDWRKKIAVH